MAWELVLFVWTIGMALMCIVGTRLRGIEDKEREHLFKKRYPTGFEIKLWDIRGPEERQKRVDEWFKKDAEERQQWRAGQPARNREKWKLRLIILVVAIVFFWSLMTMVGS